MLAKEFTLLAKELCLLGCSQGMFAVKNDLARVKIFVVKKELCLTLFDFLQD